MQQQTSLVGNFTYVNQNVKFQENITGNSHYAMTQHAKLELTIFKVKPNFSFSKINTTYFPSLIPMLASINFQCCLLHQSQHWCRSIPSCKVQSWHFLHHAWFKSCASFIDVRQICIPKCHRHNSIDRFLRLEGNDSDRCCYALWRRQRHHTSHWRRLI